MSITTPVLALVISIAYPIIGKFMLGSEKRKVSETDGKYIQLSGLLLITIAAVAVILFVVDISDNRKMRYFWLFFVSITFGFQAVVEWKYLKGSREYLVSLMVLMIGLVYILLFMF